MNGIVRKQRSRYLLSMDYEFFNSSIGRTRRLKDHEWPGTIVSCLDDGFRDFSGRFQEIASYEESLGYRVIEASSLTKGQPSRLEALQRRIINPLPEDFQEFHARFGEALAVTRARPFHFWGEERILEEIRDQRMEEKNPKPVSFFRFGQYYQYEAQFYGLWYDSTAGLWRVAVAGMDADEDYDGGIDKVWVTWPSFYEWFQSRMLSDGMNDPFLDGPGQDGAWYDPVWFSA